MGIALCGSAFSGCSRHSNEVISKIKPGMNTLIKATAADGREVIWPTTAPKINQAVAVMPSAS